MDEVIMQAKLSEARIQLSAATARAEKAEAEIAQERTWRQQYMELADKLEQQRDKAQADCAAMRSELAEARRQVDIERFKYMETLKMLERVVTEIEARKGATA